MVALRGRRNLRRFGIGIALGAGIAVAPFAVAAASADAGDPTPAPKPSIVKQAVATPALAKAVVAKPAVVRPAATAYVEKQVRNRVAVPQQRPQGAVQRAVAPQPVHAAARRAQPQPQAQAGKRVAPRIGSIADRRPVVVIGASVSTGEQVAASTAYPTRLRAETGRPVYVSAKKGAGYGDGSIAALTEQANLSARNPGLVVLQAGSNDVGAPTGEVAGQVRKVVRTVRSEAPGAKIALVTVFPTVHNGASAQRTDAAIIGAARSVDPSISVISPLAEGWNYKASDDGHPAAGAHQKVADRLAALG